MFPTLPLSLTVCKQYSGIDIADNAWDISLTAFLEASRATESYRPMLIAAMQVLKFSSGITRGGLESADGVKWLDAAKVKDAIAAYLLEQEAMDGLLTNIPVRWTIDYMRPKLCGGCDSSAVKESVPIFSAMVV